MPIALPIGLILAVFIGLLIWLAPVPMVLLALAGLASVVTVVRHPTLGLLLFCVLGTFIPYSTIQIGVRTTVSEAMIMLTWASYLLQAMFFDQPKRAPMLRTERLLLMLMLFSAFPFLVGQISVVAEGNGPINWIRWLFNLSVLFLVPRLVRERQTLEQLIMCLMLGTLALLLMSIPVFLATRSAPAMIPILGVLGYSGVDVLNSSLSALADRMGSPWMHPNVAGGAMAMILPLAFCYGLSRSGGPRSVALAVAVLGVIGLLLTGSRGALISLIAVMLWMARRQIPHLGRILLGGVFAGAMLLLLYPPLQDRIMGLFSDNDVSTAIRFLEYSHFPDAMAMFPFGIGFKVDPPVLNYTEFGISNLWLNFVYKLGIPGMLLFIAISVSWWKHVRPPKGPIVLTPDNSIALGTTCGVLAALFSGLFDHYFSFTPVLTALFWLFVGISLHENRRLHQQAIESFKSHVARPEQGERP